MYKNLPAIILAITGFLCTSATAADHTQKNPTKAAWIYMSPITPASWTYQHEQARQQVEKNLKQHVQTSYVANVPENADSERVLRDLAKQGNDIIFTTSFGYMKPALKVAQEFPNVKFEVLTGYKRTPNIATANVRFYEGAYLAGITAAHMSKSNTAGYVAGFPIPEVLRNINAFTLGMQSVKPNAQVKVIWLNTWFNPAQERAAAMTLINQGADVLSFHVASNAVAIAAQQRGKYVIARHADMRNVAPDAQIAAVTHHWGDYATDRIRALQQGTWKSQDAWHGIQHNAIRIAHFGKDVPNAVQTAVLKTKNAIATGKLHPFTGTVNDNTGKPVIKHGQTLTDAELIKMDWLVQGVQAAPFAP